MKNLKKVLAMVLAFACTFTMFAGAKVFEDVPAGSDYSEAITMLSDLGIIQGKDDGKYHPEDTITRAEACAMIARLMTGDPNVSQYTGAQNFADVAKGSWKDSAIGYCYINNIVVGVGNNKFEPDRAITDAEFITMVVRAMGYETPDMTQGYPFSYMSNAQAIGLLDDVNMVASTDALRGEDAQVIYNAMFADYARGAMLVNTTHGSSVEVYPTLAESVWDLTKAAVGEWEKNDSNDETAELTNCKAHTWVVIGADPAEEDHILAYPIDDDTTDLYNSEEKNAYKAYSFKYEGDAESVKGYQVELWGEGSHGEATWKKGEDKFVYSDNWTIKAIKTVKGQTKFDYNPSMADSKDDNGTIVLDDETSLELDSVAANAQHVEVGVGGYRQLFVAKNYNGESKMDSDSKVEAALNVRDGAQYQLMDWDGDKDIDWVVVDEARYFKVESVSSKRMTVSSMKVAGKSWEESQDSVKDTWKLDDSNDMGKNAAGKTIKVTYEVPDGIEEGDILEVTYTSKFDGDEVVTATVSVIDAESKSLDKVSTKDGLTLTFDDEDIKVAENVEENDVIVPANPTKYRDFNSEEVGVDFDLYLNRNGFIVYSDYTTDRASYAMVLDTKSGSDVLSSRGLAKVDLLTADNKHLKGVELTATATINGTSNDRKLTDGAMVGQVYKYWTNEDGQITKMTSVIGFTKDTSGAVTQYRMASNINASNYSYDADADRLIDADGKYVASLEDADVIFAVKPNSDSAQNNGLKMTTTNDGYIQTNGNDYFVDADDVLAVKQSDIPDIEKFGTGTDDTDAAYLDNKVANSTRTQTWLGANNNAAGDDFVNTFIADIDSNGKASAAILGVEDFNKFNAGSTKIGLVTNVTYANSTDGKYVELTGAFGGENKTITSAKKVDFGDIVKAYNGVNDISIDNPSATVATNLFDGANLDKYLEDGAAYAEIVTDADGNLTKVTFLNKSADNELKGHYYTVSRNITLGATNKSINYMFNDGRATSAGSNVYIAKQYYADSDNLYSVPENLAKTNDAFADDATFYSIDGAATRGDKNYAGTQLTVVDGFQRTPVITAGEDYTVIEASSIDNQNTKDSYEVADIARKNNGDVAAVYAFNDSFDETDATDVAVVSLTDTNNKPISETKAGTNVKLTAVVVDNNITANILSGVQVIDANGNDVTADWKIGDDAGGVGTKVYTDNTVTIPKTASGKYTIYGLNGAGKQYTIGALVVEVTDGQAKIWTVDALGFAAPRTGGDYQMLPTGEVAAKNPNTVYIYAASNSTYGALYVTDGVTKVENGVDTLTKNDIQIKVNGQVATITGFKQTATDGVYEVSFDKSVAINDQVSVALTPATTNIIAGSTVKGIEFSGYVTTVTADKEDGSTEGGSATANTVANIAVKVSGSGNGTLELTATDSEGKEVTGLDDPDVTVTIDGRALKDLNVSEDILNGGYKLTSKTVADWTSLSNKTITITIGGKTVTVGKLGTTNNFAAGTPTTYKIQAMEDGQTFIYTPAISNVDWANVDVKETTGSTDVKDLGIKWNAATGNVEIPASALNDKKASDPVKFTVYDKTVTTPAGGAADHVDCTVTIQQMDITVSGSYDVTNPTVLTLTLDKAITNDEVKKEIADKSKWTIKSSGASNLFVDGADVKLLNVSLDEDGKTITCTLEGLFTSDVIFNAGTKVTASDVFNTVTLTNATVALTGNITIAKQTLSKFEITSVVSGTGKKDVIIDLGLSEEEIDKLVAEVNAGTKTAFFTAMSDSNLIDDSNTGSSNAVTAVVKEGTDKIKLTLTDDLTAGDYVSVKFAGSGLYAAYDLVVGGPAVGA